ncbi:GH92 family glycosyl hydrolase [Lactiplantibacillus modestisalitolerans]|uniref:GH92 family glycosyl hydrolase n=1 Tax=Lactiplantibacillus modestisalitolerans TaxID=1457219 RepID=A0ABV5WSC0_9LACO|nr:GH92 family glycosyl hydrolase [Lactiplantibacillus modestisalitolerans]
MLIDAIDIRQGTQNSPERSHGNCLPYVGVPFAMNYFSVQTNGAAGAWFFSPTSPRFEGIRLTHQPSPWIGDYCHLLLHPVTWETPTANLDLTGNYRPREARFNAHDLRVFDDHFDALTKLTPTTYGASVQTTFYDGATAHRGLAIQLPDQGEFTLTDHGVRLAVTDYHGGEDPDLTLYLELNIPELDVNASGYYDAERQWHAASSGRGQKMTLLLATKATRLNWQLATSYVSLDQARLNLSRITPKSWAALRNESADAWNQYLDRVEVHDHHPATVQTFYSCLYRLFLFPQRFYELDAHDQPVHYDTTAKQVKPGILYTNNGFWDTSKTVYSLFSILAPELLPQFLRGFLTSYQETGYLPRWLAPDERGMMPGNLVDSIIAECAVKDLAPELMPQLLVAMKDSDAKPAKGDRYGRQGSADYDQLGYVPADRYPESVNWTQDYAYSDYCISQVAASLQQPELAAKYRRLSKRYLNLVDRASGFLRPKNANGQFKANFAPDRWGSDYTEGSAWQNSFSAYHDIPGLIAALGGPDRFDAQLSALCNTRPSYQVGGYGMVIHEMAEMAAVDYGQLAISNQPSFHLPYLFTYCGHPEKTQVTVKQLRKLFNAGFTGFPGDEDNGSMAGWFIFACLGFYPVCPADATYVRGIPAFDRVILHLPDHDVTLTTANNHDHNNFVTSFAIDGQPHEALTLTHADLLKSTNIVTRLGLVPNPA